MWWKKDLLHNFISPSYTVDYKSVLRRQGSKKALCQCALSQHLCRIIGNLTRSSKHHGFWLLTWWKKSNMSWHHLRDNHSNPLFIINFSRYYFTYKTIQCSHCLCHSLHFILLWFLVGLEFIPAQIVPLSVLGGGSGSRRKVRGGSPGSWGGNELWQELAWVAEVTWAGGLPRLPVGLVLSKFLSDLTSYLISWVWG